MKIKPFFIFVLGLCLAPAMAVPVIGAPPQDQELRVDPMAELHRDAKFIDSTELTLVTPVQLEKLLKEKPAAGYFCFAELRDKEIRQYDTGNLGRAPRFTTQRTGSFGTTGRILSVAAGRLCALQEARQHTVGFRRPDQCGRR